MSDPSPLHILHASIQTRCQEIALSHPWPCHDGCGRCCHRLSGVPVVTPPEWKLIWNAYSHLPEDVRKDVRDRVVALHEPAPYTCPFLGLQADHCLIYEARPVACRTYGFYVDRQLGLYCREMLARTEQGEWHDVVWGNAAAVEAQLDEFKERKDVQAWFACQGA